MLTIFETVSLCILGYPENCKLGICKLQKVPHLTANLNKFKHPHLASILLDSTVWLGLRGTVECYTKICSSFYAEFNRLE